MRFKCTHDKWDSLSGMLFAMSAEGNFLQIESPFQSNLSKFKGFVRHLSSRQRVAETARDRPCLHHHCVLLGAFPHRHSVQLEILRRLCVSPSVNDPPFSSISAAKNELASLRHVTQLRSTLRVVEREQISSGTPVDSHPFFFGLHRFLRHRER